VKIGGEVQYIHVEVSAPMLGLAVSDLTLLWSLQPYMYALPSRCSVIRKIDALRAQ
jgi:hypothetical protein